MQQILNFAEVKASAEAEYSAESLEGELPQSFLGPQNPKLN